MKTPIFKKIYIAIFFALLINTLFNTAYAEKQEQKTMQEEINKVINTIKNMTSAFHQSDINGVMSSYEERAAVMFEVGKSISDKHTLQQMFSNAFQLKPHFTYPKGHEVYIANDLALHIAPWLMQGKAPDGSDIEQQGLSVAVLRKQHNGEWRIVLDNPHGQQLLQAN